jgi:hypothetical protein
VKHAKSCKGGNLTQTLHKNKISSPVTISEVKLFNRVNIYVLICDPLPDFNMAEAILQAATSQLTGSTDTKNITHWKQSTSTTD